MKTLSMSAVCWLALTASATAMTGDVLFVLGDNVNVRRAPALEAQVKRQFDRGERLFERSRDGDWIEVGNEKIGDPLGWVHGSLVSRVSTKIVSSKREAAGTEDEVLILMRRMTIQIDELSREVQDLREEVRELKLDVGHMDNWTGVEIKRAYVDKGYVGHNAPKPLRVYRSGQKRGVHGQIKKELRRRAAIEPVIGHLKSEGHLERNYLKGRHGDQANAVLTAAGHNFRLVLRWLRRLLCKIIADLIAVILPVPALRTAS